MQGNNYLLILKTFIKRQFNTGIALLPVSPGIPCHFRAMGCMTFSRFPGNQKIVTFDTPTYIQYECAYTYT